MTQIYLSAKLQALFPGLDAATLTLSQPSNLGDWNGHLFRVERRKCVILVNNVSYYAVFLVDILKKDLLNFSALFLDQLLRQLTYDKVITMEEYPVITAQLGQLQLRRTNNDRKALGTINEFIFLFKGHCEGRALNSIDLATINHYINNVPTGAGRTSKRLYGNTIDDMRSLITQMMAS